MTGGDDMNWDPWDRDHIGEYTAGPNRDNLRARLAAVRAGDKVTATMKDYRDRADRIDTTQEGAAMTTDDRDALAEVLYPSHKASECSRAACHQCAQTYRTVDAILGSDWLYRYADRVAAAARADERRKVAEEIATLARVEALADEWENGDDEPPYPDSFYGSRLRSVLNGSIW